MTKGNEFDSIIKSIGNDMIAPRKIRRGVLDAIIISLFILALIGMIFIYKGIKAEGTQCIKNPLPYGIDKLEKANQGKVACSCTLTTGSGTLPFYVDSQNISTIDILTQGK